MAGQRTVAATLGTIAEAVEREGVKAPALIVVGPVVAAPRSARLAGASAPARQARRRHPRPGAGQRPRRDAARARRRGGRAAGDPDRAADRAARRCARAVERIGEYALVCVTSPNGATCCSRRWATAGPADWRRAALRRRTTVAAIGPGTARASPSTGSPPTSSPSALSPRRWSRRWPRSRSRAARPHRPRRRGARRPPRRPARARRRGRRRRPLRDRPRGARRRRRSRPPRAPTTSPSPPPRPSPT